MKTVSNIRKPEDGSTPPVHAAFLSSHSDNESFAGISTEDFQKEIKRDKSDMFLVSLSRRNN